jgi:dTDP-glucose 4,6-dehydratase
MEDFEFPEGEFTHVIHAATTPYPLASEVSRYQVFNQDVAGTRRVLDFAGQKRIRRMLFTSSGAVYGRQPPELTHVPENWPGAPSPLDAGSGYGQAKRASEFLCTTSGIEFGFDVVIARLFAFVGPYLPLDSIFAVGNFVRDALRGGPIRIQGDGTPYRSYLYAADMAIWLWVLLLKGRPGDAYNVGSSEAVTILDLARRVARVHGLKGPIEVAGRAEPGQPPSRYVPDVGKAGHEFGLHAHIGLEDGIARYLAWCDNANVRRSSG